MREGFIAPSDGDQPALAPQRAPVQSQPVPQSQSQPEPSAQVVDIPARPAWPMVIKLRNKPIIGPRGESIDELKFREPTGGDVMRIGNPCWIRSDGELMIDDPKMMRMMGQLSGVLAPLLEAMHPKDYNSCAYRLRPFFIPDWDAW
jgi:hypothetical protein